MKNIKKQFSQVSIKAKQLNQPFRLMAQDEWGNIYAVAYGERADLEAILAVTSPDRNPEIVPNN